MSYGWIERGVGGINDEWTEGWREWARFKGTDNKPSIHMENVDLRFSFSI